MSNETTAVPDAHKNNFQLLRLLAALQVVAIHSIGHLRIPTSPLLKWVSSLLSLFPGVPIFFVISGFLVSRSFEQSTSTKSYFVKRFLRIYPALWTCFLLTLCILGGFGFLKANSLLSWQFLSWIAAQLSLGQFYNPQMFRGFGVGVINGSLWTIPVEVGFYILLPWYYSMFRMNASRTSGNLALWGSILLFGLVSVLVSVAEGQADIVIKIIRVTPVPHLYLFLLGVLLQRNEHFVKRYLAGKAVIWWVSYLLLMYGVEAGFGLEVSASPLFVLPSRVILGCVAIAFCFSWIELSSKLLGQLDLSYGIYLYHMLVVNSLLQVGYAGKFSGLIISFSLSIVLAWISWVVIEAPCLRLKHLTAVPSLKNSALFK